MVQSMVKKYYVKPVNGRFYHVVTKENGKEVKAFKTNYELYNSAWQQAERMNKRSN